MREAFITKDFGPEALRRIEIINEILDDYERQGYDVSTRQLYYQLVSKNIIPNTEKSYASIKGLVSDARLAGLIDWDMIKDRGREVIINPHWTSPAEFLRQAAPQYRVDLWANQDNYVEVMVEKQALEGVLEPVCRSLDVPFTSNKGYTSSSALYEASKRYLKRKEQGKNLFVIYCGDHDPSGIDMSRDIADRLDLFVKTSADECHLIGPNEEPAVTMVRVALNMSQIRELNPPPNPAKLTDSRASGYVANFGRESWELDAVPVDKLAKLVKRAVIELMDVDLFDQDKAEMMAAREKLLEFANTFEQDDSEHDNLGERDNDDDG